MNEHRYNILVYIFLGVISICKALGLSSNNRIYIITFALGTFLAIIKIINDKFTKRELIIMIMIGLVGIIDLFIGGTSTVLFTIVVLSCTKNINIKRVLKIFFWTKVWSILIMILFSGMGIIENNFIIHYRAGIGFVKRFCFGYGHPNIAQLSLAIIIILGYYLYPKKYNIIIIILLGSANYLLYKYTLSRTSFLISMFFLISIILYKYIKIYRSILLYISKNSTIIFFIVSIAIAILYERFNVIKVLDVMVTGRFGYMNTIITNYIPPLFGSQKYNEVVMFDNGYFTLLYEGGVLATIFFLYYLTKLTYKFYKEKKELELILIFFMSMLGFFESFYINIVMNCSLIFISHVLFKERKANNEKNYDFYTYI